MAHQQKAGGISALLMAASFVVGIAVFGTVLLPAGYLDPDTDPVQKVATLVENQAVLTLSYLVAFVVFGALLVVLALALHERLKGRAAGLTRAATVFGMIWAGLVIASGMVAVIGIRRLVELYAVDPAQAGSIWLTLDFVVNGLGGEMEIVGALWVLLISWAPLRAGGLPKALAYLGVAAGAAGLLTVIPALADLAAVFGLALIVWFIWVGIVLLRGSRSAAA